MRKKLKMKLAIILIHFCIEAQTQLPDIGLPPPSDKHTKNSLELTIGSHVPNFEFNEVMNYRSKSARLSDLQGKLTILDFWSTACGTCVDLFPHMQALKDKFKGQLQILLVNGKTKLWHDNESKITNLLHKQEDITNTRIDLPIILNSSEIDQAFPWQTIPHEVWINDKNEVLAITGPMEVNEQNIQAILNGTKFQMRLKADYKINLQETTLQEIPYIPKNKFSTSQYASTIIKGFLPGVVGQGIRSSRNKQDQQLITGWYNINQSLFSLLLSAYSNVISLPYNRIILEVEDTIKFQKELLYDTAYYGKVYSYDITFPSGRPYNQIFSLIQQDLARAFHVTMQLQKRLIPCLILISSADLLKNTNNGGEKIWAIDKAAGNIKIKNYSITEIIQNFNDYSPIPLIDSTGITDAVDLTLPIRFKNINDLEEILKKVGFTIREEYRQMDIAVLKEI